MRAAIVSSSFVFSQKRWNAAHYLGSEQEDLQAVAAAEENLKRAQARLKTAKKKLKAGREKVAAWEALGLVKRLE